MDVPDLKYVVLFRPVGSMVEFKQIIGRGARLSPDKGKTSFEVVDYVGATAKFTDPDFDGFPVHITTEQVDAAGTVVDRAEVAAESDGTGGFEPEGMVREPLPEFQTQREGTFAAGETDPAPPRRKPYVDDGYAEVVAEALELPDRSSGRLVLTEYGEHVVAVVQALGSPTPLTGRSAREVVHRPVGASVVERLCASCEPTALATT